MRACINFVDSFHCTGRHHCNTCRNDPAWRSAVGAPTACPFNVISHRIVRPPHKSIQMLSGIPSADTFVNFFDQVYIINLARRTDRLHTITKHLYDIGWPFKYPIILPATDGKYNNSPAQWTSTNGTWWNLQSHISCLEHALSTNAQTILVMEDDVFFLPNFRQRCAQLLQSLPSDWDAIMLGGRFVRSGSGTETISPTVRRVWGINNIEATAYHARFATTLLQEWKTSRGHSDEIFRSIQKDYRVYAPTSVIATQRSGLSDNFDRARSGSWTAASPTDVEGAIILSIGQDRKDMLTNATASISRTTPGLNLRIVSDQIHPNYTTTIVPMLTGMSSRSIKTQILCQSPWQYSIYLDDDCVVLNCLPPLQQILADADISIAVDCFHPTMGDALTLWEKGQNNGEEARATRQEYPDCDSMPHFNSGVIIWKSNPATAKLSKIWYEEWLRFQSIDQLALFRALQRCPDVKVYVLPVQYHCPSTMAATQGDPSIVHFMSAKWNFEQWLRDRDLPVLKHSDNVVDKQPTNN